jgi:CheY-like chemotaxis protein
MTVYSDELRLKQILINLISNAVKFTLHGSIKLNLSVEQNFLKFEVEDTGIGIKDSIKEFMYNPYNKSHSNNQLGAGLGLSIIYDLTTKLGKTIDYVSKVDKGSSFWFSIPIKSNKYHIGRILNKDLKTRVTKIFARIKHLKKEGYRNSLTELNEDNANNYSKITNDSFSSVKIKESRLLLIDNSPDIDQSSITIESNESKDTIKMENIKLTNNFLNKVNHLSISINPDKPIDYIITYEKQIIDENNKKITTSPRNEIPESQLLKSSNSPKNSLRPETSKNNSLNKKPSYDLIKISNSRDSASHRKSIDFSSNHLVTTFQRFNSGIENFCDIIEKYFQRIKTDKGLVIVVVDDEKLTRMSTIRLLTTVSNNLNLNLCILEAEDGVECLYIVYCCLKKGIKINCIFSDETMSYLKGSFACELLKKIFNNYINVPYYIITAYEDNNTMKMLKNFPINDIFTKPLLRGVAEKILLTFK